MVAALGFFIGAIADSLTDKLDRIIKHLGIKEDKK